MKSIALAAAMALLSIPAMADCPTGGTLPCSTGSVHILGANQTCFKIQFTPTGGPAFLAALPYLLYEDPFVVDGLLKTLSEGAALSLVTTGSTAMCGSGADGPFQVINGTRAPGY
jgi:hypothetical protein